jgi:hypothetical protein
VREQQSVERGGRLSDLTGQDDAGCDTRGEEVISMSSSAEHAHDSRPEPEQHISAQEQARRQGVRPIASVDELAFPGYWESDEELDEFLADLYAARRANLP